MTNTPVSHPRCITYFLNYTSSSRASRREAVRSMPGRPVSAPSCAGSRSGGGTLRQLIPMRPSAAARTLAHRDGALPRCQRGRTAARRRRRRRQQPATVARSLRQTGTQSPTPPHRSHAARPVRRRWRPWRAAAALARKLLSVAAGAAPAGLAATRWKRGCAVHAANMGHRLAGGGGATGNPGAWRWRSRATPAAGAAVGEARQAVAELLCPSQPPLLAYSQRELSMGCSCRSLHAARLVESVTENSPGLQLRASNVAGLPGLLPLSSSAGSAGSQQSAAGGAWPWPSHTAQCFSSIVLHSLPTQRAFHPSSSTLINHAALTPDGVRTTAEESCSR